MRNGIGTLRDNQQKPLCLIWIYSVWKKSVDNKALVVWQSRDFRRDMTWRDMMWHDMTWYDMTWHDVTGHDRTWHGMMWHDVTWRDMAWHGTTLHDMTWHMTWRMTWHLTWHDVIGCDMTWRGMRWHDMAWRDMTSFARLLINLEHFCQGTNVWVTSKTSWTGRWPEILRPLKHGSSVGMSAKDSLTSKA